VEGRVRTQGSLGRTELTRAISGLETLKWHQGVGELKEVIPAKLTRNCANRVSVRYLRQRALSISCLDWDAIVSDWRARKDKKMGRDGTQKEVPVVERRAPMIFRNLNRSNLRASQRKAILPSESGSVCD